MKKAIYLLLALMMVISLCACGGSSETATTMPETTLPPTEATTAPPTEPFSELGEEYSIELPLYSLIEYYSSLGDDTYTYQDFTYDEQGRILSWSTSENGRAAFGYTATYDEAGRLSSVTYHHSLYGYTEVYVYNEQGQLIASTKTEPDDGDFYLTRSYTYDENGMLAGGKTVSSSSFYDGGIDKYGFELDEYGRIVKNFDHALDTDYLHENTYEYNDRGQLIVSHQSTIDEGMLNYVYDTTYEYSVYGFPVYCYVDNSYDYKGDTTKWQGRSTYAVTGHLTVNSASDPMLNPVSSWVPYGENSDLPALDSVISGLTLVSAENGTYRYAVPASENPRYEYDIFGIMQGLNSYGILDLRAYSSQDSANQVLWRYEAVVTQLLGFKTVEHSDYIDIMMGSFSLARISVEYADGTYYLVVTI